jgi:hypothetical protein
VHAGYEVSFEEQADGKRLIRARAKRDAQQNVCSDDVLRMAFRMAMA